MSEYSRRDCQDKAWHDVSIEVNLSGKYTYSCYFYFNILIIVYISKLNIDIYNYNPQNTLNTFQIYLGYNIIK